MTPEEEAVAIIRGFGHFLLAVSAASPKGLQLADEYCWKEFMRIEHPEHVSRIYLELHLFLERERKTRAV